MRDDNSRRVVDEENETTSVPRDTFSKFTESTVDRVHHICDEAYNKGGEFPLSSGYMFHRKAPTFGKDGSKPDAWFDMDVFAYVPEQVHIKQFPRKKNLVQIVVVIVMFNDMGGHTISAGNRTLTGHTMTSSVSSNPPKMDSQLMQGKFVKCMSADIGGTMKHTLLG